VIDKSLGEIKILNEESDRIKVFFYYNPLFIEKIKTIKGRIWYPEGKYWSFPQSDVMRDAVPEKYEHDLINRISGSN
jgi:hypothetical protein